MKHLVIGHLQKPAKLHGPSMLPDKAKFVVCTIISLALSFWMKHLVIGLFWMKHLVIGQLQKPAKLHGPSMLPDKAKRGGVSIRGYSGPLPNDFIFCS